MSSIPISLKWGKNRYTLSIEPGSSTITLKQQVESLTGVPISRQKLLCPKLWKGPLQNVDILPQTILSSQNNHSKGSNIVVTLIGSADVLIEKSIEERPVFAEDMTPEELWKATRGKDINEQDDEDDVVDIPALQKRRGMERDDGKKEMYQYNRLVTGLPQGQINDMLVSRKKKIEEDGAYNNGTSTSPLMGEVAMTMGMELRRAYINSLAVLPNGTIVSGLDDGHVQLWRRGRMIKDAIHPNSSKVEHVLPFPSSSTNSSDVGSSATTSPDFVTAGEGSMCLWTEDGNHLARIGSNPGTSPSSIAIGSISHEGRSITYVAVCNKITRQVDPNQFRLVPQNEAERRRREAALAHEQMIQNNLEMSTRHISLYFYDAENPDNNNNSVSFISPESYSESAPVTKLLDLNGNLVCGDVWGGIRIYEWVAYPHHRQASLMQFKGGFSISCFAKVKEHLLAVSIQPTNGTGTIPSATPLLATKPFGVYLIDTKDTTPTVKVVLDAHSYTVKCLCRLPNGDILSAGGRMDATVRVWSSSYISNALKDSTDDGEEVKVLTEAPILKEPGYVLDLAVLPDLNGSDVYAIAAARYNVIKIVI